MNMSAIVRIYVSLVINEVRRFSSVPATVKPDVRAELIARGREDLIDE